MENLFIGVDGGGTKTEAIIQNANGQRIGRGVSGPGNIKTSALGSFQSVQTAVQHALISAGIQDSHNYHLHLGLGMAGTEVPAAKAAFLQIPHPFHTIVLNSDAYIACLGVHAGQDGAILIVGTGVIGMQIENNAVSRAGGYGFPHSDEGGGAWIGLELMRATFKAYDGYVAWTPALEKVFAHFNHDIQIMTTFANASAAKPGNFGELSHLLIEALDEHDPFATELLMDAAHHVNQIWDALSRKTKAKLPCCLLGGISPFVHPYLTMRLKSCIVPRKMDATEGAILMLKKHMGLIT